MKSKIVKPVIIVLCIVISLFLYKLPIITSWRNYNNGVRAFNENNFQLAAVKFDQAKMGSKNPILEYNRCISLWSGILKKQKDKKNAEKNEIIQSIHATNQAITNLLRRQTLKNDYLAKLGYAKGTLFLITSQIDSAKNSFQQAISWDKSFTPPLVEMVKLESTSWESVSVPTLLVNITSVEPLDINRKWKPF